MSLPGAAQEALERFTQAAGWEARARLLMQWGERLEAFPEALRDEQHRVRGCASAVWLAAQRDAEHWHFVADSDARLLRGLLALLLDRVNGVPLAQLETLDLPAWFAELGLSRQLSPSRSNGLNAVLARMRELSAPA